MYTDPGGGTLYISGWGCAAGTLKPDHAQLILQPYTRLDTENPYHIPDLLLLELCHY